MAISGNNSKPAKISSMRNKATPFTFSSLVIIKCNEKSAWHVITIQYSLSFKAGQYIISSLVKTVC
jgi:hypothetical protein